ncbi:MAG: FAD-dependent monooxygenase [Geminicoccaceae bacterium]
MRHPVVIVGGGPVGLALAVDLGGRGVRCVVVDGKPAFGEGSRGLCYAKRTLEILDRLGVGERAVAKGVIWRLGKVFHGTGLLYQFDLLPEGGHKMPAFINLQQYYIEQYLYERALELPSVDLRFQNRCVGLETFADHARVRLETPDGPYAIEADWLIACDGARSSVRQLMGLSFEGRAFEDVFVIA